MLGAVLNSWLTLTTLIVTASQMREVLFMV